MLLFGVLPLFGQNWVQKCTNNGQKRGSKIFVLRLRRENFQNVAFMWGVAFIYPKKNFEVYALIRSVAFIRVLLLFGGFTPCFGQFFSKVPASQTLLSPKSEKKKWGNPHRWAIRRGEPHFFRFCRDSACTCLGGKVPGFLEGGDPYKPHAVFRPKTAKI